MKRVLPIILIFVVGLGVLLYPTISNIIAENSQQTTIRVYEDTIESISPEIISKMKEEAREYNKSLTQNKISDPFSDKTDDSDDIYNSLLNLGEVMGYVDIPSIDVYLPAFHGTSADVLQKGIGHLQGTSLPVGGVGSHTVLSSHRGLPSARLFTDLDQLQKGDMFYIYILDEVLAYKIDQIVVVDPSDISNLMIDPNMDYATLLTCTPYGINSHRMLVRGVRVEFVEYKKHENISIPIKLANEVFVIPAVWISIALFIPLLILAIRQNRKDKKMKKRAALNKADNAKRVEEERLELRRKITGSSEIDMEDKNEKDNEKDIE